MFDKLIHLYNAIPVEINVFHINKSCFQLENVHANGSTRSPNQGYHCQILNYTLFADLVKFNIRKYPGKGVLGIEVYPSLRTLM